MNRVDPRIEPLLAQMAKDPALPAGAENSIRQTIAESPYLSNLLGDAIEKGRIGAIAVSHGQNNGVTSRTVRTARTAHSTSVEQRSKTSQDQSASTI